MFDDFPNINNIKHYILAKQHQNDRFLRERRAEDWDEPRWNLSHLIVILNTNSLILSFITSRPKYLSVKRAVTNGKKRHYIKFYFWNSR